MCEFDPKERDRKTPNLLIVQGDEIIVNPDVGQVDGKCWRAMEPHLSQFIANGLAFERRLGEEERRNLMDAGREAQVFGSSIESNLKKIAREGARGSWTGLFRSSRASVGKIEVTKKLKGPKFRKFLVKNGVMPDARLYVAEDRAALENANCCRIYEMENAGVLFRIFAIFVTRFSDGGATCGIATVHNLLVKENGFVKEIKDANERKPACTFIVIGAPDDLGAKVVPVKLDHVFEIIATPNAKCVGANSEEWRPEYGWSISRPSIRALSQTERCFIHALYPLTVDELKDCVRFYVDKSSYSCFNVKDLCSELELPDEDDDFLIHRACNLLIDSHSDEYRAHKKDDGTILLEKGDFKKSKEKLRFPDSALSDQRRMKGIIRWLRLLVAATIGIFIGAIGVRLLLAMENRGYTSLTELPTFLDGLRPKDIGFWPGVWCLTKMCLAEVYHVIRMMLVSVLPVSLLALSRTLRDFIGHHVFNASWHRLKSFLEAE